MNKALAGLMGAGLVVVALPVMAEEHETPEVYTYATYYHCPGGSLQRADEIMASDNERMDELVEDGTISAWGWLAHHTGGQWQRVSYHQAGSLDALLDAADAIQDTDDDDAETWQEFGQICNTHDDYIWQVEAGTVGKERGAAGFSVYHVCDSRREGLADEIVASHVAPIFNRLVEEGKLTSWSWQSHVVGGEFRKLQTMTAADHKGLLAARAEAIEAIYGDGSDMGAALVDICNSHVDYMWNIVAETP